MEINPMLAKMIDNVEMKVINPIELDGVSVKLIVAENDKSILISGQSKTNILYIIAEINKVDSSLTFINDEVRNKMLKLSIVAEQHK